MFKQSKPSGYYLFFLVVFLASIFGASPYAFSQKVNYDSLKLVRQHSIDSTRAVQKRILDSTKAKTTRFNDSVKAVRKVISDSMATKRAYRESKRYKDSVAALRQGRLDSIRTDRMAFNDSLKVERKRVLDSTNAIRNARLEATRAVQKKRSDSLGVIRAYRESKRYQDSVAISRQQRLDSSRIARQEFNDSIRAFRKQVLDSATAVRKKVNDSLTALRTKRTDSLEAARKVRTDKLAKQKEERERLNKSTEKKKEEKMQLALELKIKKKRQAWSNEKMLKKKWSVPRRVLQNTFTRFNYYFNADKRMDEALANMMRLNKENLDSTIALFPFDPDRDSTKMLADMDSIIQKASLGIQIHDPRTKWGDDLYLLLGQAYYYKGDYENAISSFRYIISINQKRKADALKQSARSNKAASKEPISVVEKEEKSTLDFLKHKSVNNEAILWLARTYTEAHKEGEAESVLDLLDSDQNLSEDSRGRLALEKSYLNLSRNNNREASKHLAVVTADKNLPDWIRTRAGYLNGQLLAEQGNYAGASESFQRVIDLKPKIEMDFYARKNLAYNKLENGGDPEETISGLKKLLSDGKYAPYHEQVYYVLGRLAANGNRFDDAITYLQKSVSSPKATKKQKALSFSSLGNVYYSKGDYRNAKLSYDSAAYLARFAPNDTIINVAVKRAGVLDKVAYPTQVIREQDSLLALANMSEKEQRAVIRRYIRSLEDAKADSVAKAENGDLPNTAATDGDNGGSATSWYFSNPVLMQQGLNDFKRKWGTRSNVDNWRRGSKTGSTIIAETQNQQGDEDLVGFDENGIPTELSLFAQIPSSAAQKEAANKKIQKAYLDLGGAYVNDLGDYSRGLQTLDSFDSRYPSNDSKAEVLYLRYQLALRQNNLSLAQNLSERIRKEYPNTKWSELVGPAEDSSSPLLASNTGAAASYYDETYNIMMQRDYVNLLQRVKEGQKQYNNPAYKKRFQIMEAIALAGTGEYDQADTLITKFISTHPSDSLKMWADAVSKYIKRTRPVTPPPTAAASLVDSANSLPVNILTNPNGTTKIPASSSPDAASSATPPGPESIPAPPPPAEGTAASKIPPTYVYNSKSQHFYIFYFYKAESKAMGVKAALNDFNTFNYSGQNLKSNFQMLQPTQGIITVKSFPSAAAAKIYMNVVNSNKAILKEYKSSEYQSLIISDENFAKLSQDKDLKPYIEFYKKQYK